MKKYMLFSFLSLLVFASNAQSSVESEVLKYKLNESGSRFFQVTFLNQVWLRFNQSNPGTTVIGDPQANTLDIGLRRTRMQLFGQITDRTFLYFQFGQNNFNAMYNATSNRKLAPFFHDALGEYRVSSGNQLKIGGGLTITTGISRFSQPSIGTILTTDVPVFAQTTVDQIDQFGRKLSIYARGQIGKFDYRAVLSDPFPVTSNGQTPPALSSVSNFASKGHSLQTAGYLIYQFFDHENHLTPYMNGTYLGSKKIFNIAIGGAYQPNAMWSKSAVRDTLYQAMQHVAIESFLDMPVGTKNSIISAYLGYFNTNYGTNYLRYNGIMNPASGTTLTASNSITGQGPTYGNALPMFGTGNVVYTQIGYMLPSKTKGLANRWMPYASATIASFDRLNGLPTNTFNLGVKYYLNGNKSKLSLDYQNRPSYRVENSEVKSGDRLGTVTLQMQVNI